MAENDEAKPKRKCLSMNAEELCSVDRVNKQFRILARKSFSERYETFGNLYLEDSDFGWRRVLCNFGDLIKSLSLRDRGLRYDVDLEAVSKYCAGTVQELELGINAPIDRKSEDLVKPLFSSVKKLKTCSWEYFGRCIEACTDLKILYLYADEDNSDLTHAQNIPNLEELELIIPISNVKLGTTLFRLNPQIKKLRMELMERWYGCVVGKLTLQRRLNACFQELGKLKSLKVLELDDLNRHEHNIYVPSMENISLEHLK